MRKFTKREEENGEMAVRNLSEKADWICSITSPVTVWEIEKNVEDDEGEYLETVKTYAIDFGGWFTEGLSFEELEDLLEEEADNYLEWEAQEAEED